MDLTIVNYFLFVSLIHNSKRLRSLLFWCGLVSLNRWSSLSDDLNKWARPLLNLIVEYLSLSVFLLFQKVHSLVPELRIFYLCKYCYVTFLGLTESICASRILRGRKIKYILLSLITTRFFNTYLNVFVICLTLH